MLEELVDVKFGLIKSGLGVFAFGKNESEVIFGNWHAIGIIFPRFLVNLIHFEKSELVDWEFLIVVGFVEQASDDGLANKLQIWADRVDDFVGIFGV